ncbi:DUF1501 domain-containing protein [Endozoicomonadaceae bacterium StTr2]
MKGSQLSRRSFLQKSGVVMAGSSLLLSGLPGTQLMAGTRQEPPINLRPQQKALVFLMLDGGNDSYNMLVPMSAPEYKEYADTRGHLALPEQKLLPLNSFEDGKGEMFGLHPSMPEVQQLFNTNKLSFVANVGPLIERVSKSEFYSNTRRLPVGLMSHSDQFRHWQTSRPGERINRGWFGAFADVLQPDKTPGQVPMNISLAGSNIMQNGAVDTSYAITEKGSVGMLFKDQNGEFDRILQRSVDGVLNRRYDSAFKQTYASFTRTAQRQHESFSSAVNKVNLGTRFSDSDLSKQLKMVARSIKASADLGLPQQTFFLRYIGWDHHDELLKSHARMLRIVSQAMGEFQAALNELDIADKVVTFTGSDFGRTLTSNGNGTDHGWGGNIMVMGEAVNGGKVFGDYPSLALNSDLDVGDGVLIPTTSTDQVYAELAMWFGVNRNDLTTLFPNLGNFYKPATGEGLLGLINA